jgi:hypothetical protein
MAAAARDGGDQAGLGGGATARALQQVHGLGGESCPLGLQDALQLALGDRVEVHEGVEDVR